MVFAILLMLVVAVIGAAVMRKAGNDQINAARMGTRERAVACAEAGLQYGRRYFGAVYEATHGWNDYLSNTATGYRYDPARDAVSDVDALPDMVRGDSDNDGDLDPGTDLNGDGNADFWVSIRDDDDERPLGAANDPDRDNNEAVVLRSECTDPALALEVGGRRQAVFLEALLVHVQGASGYGNAQITSNSPDIVGTRTLGP